MKLYKEFFVGLLLSVGLIPGVAISQSNDLESTDEVVPCGETRVFKDQSTSSHLFKHGTFTFENPDKALELVNEIAFATSFEPTLATLLAMDDLTFGRDELKMQSSFTHSLTILLSYLELKKALIRAGLVFNDKDAGDVGLPDSYRYEPKWSWRKIRCEDECSSSYATAKIRIKTTAAITLLGLDPINQLTIEAEVTSKLYCTEHLSGV